MSLIVPGQSKPSIKVTKEGLITLPDGRQYQGIIAGYYDYSIDLIKSVSSFNITPKGVMITYYFKTGKTSYALYDKNMVSLTGQKDQVLSSGSAATYDFTDLSSGQHQQLFSNNAILNDGNIITVVGSSTYSLADGNPQNVSLSNTVDYVLWPRFYTSSTAPKNNIFNNFKGVATRLNEFTPIDGGNGITGRWVMFDLPDVPGLNWNQLYFPVNTYNFSQNS